LEFVDLKISTDLSSSPGIFNVFHDLYINHEHRQINSYKKCKSVLFDIGANEGFYTLIMAQTSPNATIYAFEPNPIAFNKLQENIKLNNLKNVKLFNTAVTQTSGQVKLEYIPEITPISSVNIRALNLAWLTDTNRIKKINVTGITLDDFLSQHQIPSIEIIKIDVEGSEVAVLKGAHQALKITQKLVIEYHSLEIKKDLFTILNQQGFRQVLEEKLPSSSQNSTGDIYFEKLS